MPLDLMATLLFFKMSTLYTQREALPVAGRLLASRGGSRCGKLQVWLKGQPRHSFLNASI